MHTRIANHLRFRLILLCACVLLTGAFFAQPAAASAARPDTAKVSQGTYSPAALSSVMARVPTAQPWATIVRPLLSEWYVDAPADRVVVGLTAITSAARAAAHAAFGGAVELTVAPRATLAVRVLTADGIVPLPAGAAGPDSGSGTRRDDHQPFYGGDEIISYRKISAKKYEAEQCTSSFDVYDHRAKVNAMVSAGHCTDGKDYDDWYSAYVSKGLIRLGALEGVIDTTERAAKTPDAATITLHRKSGTYSPHIFVGPVTSSASYPLAGSASLSRGERICTDGIDSGAQICGASITQTNLCLILSGDGEGPVETCHLAEATYTKSFCIPGDSGGPVYSQTLLRKDHKIYALGTIEGYQPGHDNCFFNELGPVLSALKANLITTT